MQFDQNIKEEAENLKFPSLHQDFGDVFFFRTDDKSHEQEEMAIVVMPRRPSIAEDEVRSMMKGSDEMQKIIIDTAPSMGPVPDNKKNSRPFREQ